MWKYNQAPLKSHIARHFMSSHNQLPKAAHLTTIEEAHHYREVIENGKLCGISFVLAPKRSYGWDSPEENSLKDYDHVRDGQDARIFTES
jgi:hypothetical protein